jgi:peptidoglycan biosynthesis protein MviN/MurJ (putative lipid II flippase)
MIKKGIGVTIIFIISTFIQLVSQIVVTRLFGARIDLDIFLAAVAMPTIFVTIIYGTLNDAFLPLYGERRAQNNADADSYFFSTLLLLTGISFVIALLMNLFSPVISAALYQSRGEQFVKDVSIQMSYMFYSIPLSVIATLFGTYLYVQKKFIRFPLAQLIGSLANLAIIILLAPTFRIWALVVAFVINILIQIIFVIPKLTFSFNFKNIKFYTLLIAWIPLIIGSFALRTDTLLIRSFGASLPQGYLVYLNLISKIFSLATSVMTIGIQIILLPHIVEYLSNKNYTKAIENVNKAKITAVGISVVVTILLALIAPIAIKLLFVGNKFTPKDAEVTISLLPLFILPAIGWGVNSVFF